MPLEVFEIDVSRAALPPEPANFIGAVRMQNLARAADAASVECLAVHFPPGGRTRPHTHPGEQILFFVRGGGFVHLAGEHEQRVDEGAIVIVPASVVHMHGATDAAPLCHIASRAADGPTDWAPPHVPPEWQGFMR